jgi:hypothetical protein
MHLEFLAGDQPDADAQFGVAPDQITTEVLELFDAFFRQASPIVRTELHQFLTEHGHRYGGLGWFLDALGLTTLARRPMDNTPGRPVK